MRARSAIAAAAIGTGCYTSRDASTLVVMTGSPGRGATNATASLTQSIVASPRQTATTAEHWVLWTLAGVALVALVAAGIWLVHNRAKLLGLAAGVASKL
jgi:hypothetical protein